MLANSADPDWAITLKSAFTLLEEGQALDELASTGKLSNGLPHFTGSMLLSICVVESFSASIAAAMPSQKRFKTFELEAYRRTAGFWEKLELLFAAVPFEIDRSVSLFQSLQEMQDWRNLITGAAPNAGTQYAALTDFEHAKKFYNAASNYIGLLTELTGLNPRTKPA